MLCSRVMLVLVVGGGNGFGVVPRESSTGLALQEINDTVQNAGNVGFLEGLALGKERESSQMVPHQDNLHHLVEVENGLEPFLGAVVW